MKRIFRIIICIQLCCSCCINLREYGDQHIRVFDDALINSGSSPYNKELIPDQDNVIRLSNGRVILKKITVPNFEKHTDVSVQLRLVSNGDMWDKAGSAFIIPSTGAINLLEIARGNEKFEELPSAIKNLKGSVPGEQYMPCIELLRFMTPFGVGHYSDKYDFIRPVYIPRWAREVVWKQDVTKLLSELEGEAWVGIYIDTHSSQGYKVTMDLEYKESDIFGHAAKKKYVKSLLNNVPYIGGISPHNMFFERTVDVEFEIEEGTVNNKLLYITTGHGGYGGGDEFNMRVNEIYIDDKKRLSFKPWREDCATFRRFNPTSGVWPHDKKSKNDAEKVRRDYIASSDLPRTNWCPGSDVPPEEIDLSYLKPGKHKLTINIPEAQSADKKSNYWLVSATLVGEYK